MASFGIGAMLVTMLTMAGAYGKYALCERDDLDKQLGAQSSTERSGARDLS